ncbi:DNA alkylation repair protein [Leptospira kmetyi]|uniref:DNA alkylation repair protein n=1 Tax=Leptospira kmetyi TaxID=408139 RepID=UPI000287DE1D|nr:DNA alkylation repair protein [Leptospira kmetyi]EQA52024.1 DNA alkylation repair enzyme [Leptospira kmetyi serovar Malaysia str. Bejo-Iso9]
MDSITSKKEIKSILDSILSSSNQNENAIADEIVSELLSKKIKFPLLEFAAKELYSGVPERNQIPITDRIIERRTIGGNVIAGMILQLRSDKHFEQSVKKAIDYMVFGDEWYVCDIIGERVMGYSLLQDPEKTLPVLKKFLDHKNAWISRSVGVAAHYAVKKGLRKKYVEEIFLLLLAKADTNDFHTKKGIGWAVKTVSKFHPDIVAKFESRLNSDKNIGTFFKTKIKIGLGRSSKYASRYSD